MTLPYENAASGDAALGEIRKVLTKFGCARFGTMTDTEAGELIVVLGVGLAGRTT